MKEKNLYGKMVVDFAKRMEMTGVNTYRRRSQGVLYCNSGGRSTNVDWKYREDQKE